MDCTLTGRHVEVTEELRALVQRRLAPLDRLLGDAAVSADMVMAAAERPHYQTEFVVHARGNHRLHGVGTGESWPVAVGAAVDKVMHQAQTLKGKWQARRRRAEAVPGAGPDRDGSVDPDEPTSGEWFDRVVWPTLLSKTPWDGEPSRHRVWVGAYAASLPVPCEVRLYPVGPAFLR